MMKLLLSTLRVALRWGFLWLRSQTTVWLVAMVRYRLITLARGSLKSFTT